MEVTKVVSVHDSISFSGVTTTRVQFTLQAPTSFKEMAHFLPVPRAIIQVLLNAAFGDSLKNTE